MFKKYVTPFLCILLSFVLYNSAFATTYYVATNGDNSYNGLYPTYQGGSNGPWKAINYGVKKLGSGDTLYIRGGTYYEVVTVDTNGIGSNRITIASYPGETAIIDGYDTIPTGQGGVLFRINGDYITVRNIEVKNSAWTGIISYGTYTEIINVYTHHNMRSGIMLTADRGLVEDCVSYWDSKNNEYGKESGTGQWASGILAARRPEHCILRRNTVRNNWGQGLNTYEAQYTIMEDNVIYDSWGPNIYISDARHVICRRNLVYATGFMDKYDGTQAGIAISNEKYNPSVQDNTIINNLVMGAKCCIYFWPGPRSDRPGLINTIIANNTFVNSVYEATIKINSSSHRNTRVENNIFLQENSLPVALIAGTTAGITFSHNNWSKTPPPAAYGSGDVIGDPKLQKSGSTGPGLLTPEYFKIFATSPARDNAKVIDEVTEDFFRASRGKHPDMGGHEYGGSDPHPPDPPTGLQIF